MTDKLAMGFMDPAAFLEFLGNAPDAVTQTAETLAPGGGFALAAGAAFLGGLALNLTPCVLPMLPVNLILMGKGFGRGLAYGAGIAVAYGALGIAAAFFGMPFGALLGKAWFNFAVAAIFATLALGMSGVFRVDFTRFRSAVKGNARPASERGAGRLAGLFGLGALSAVLAGACVAPVALATLAETAARVAAGDRHFAALPFALGLGMAAPYPFLAAGIARLPKPGKWMKAVNALFACVLALLAVRYAAVGWEKAATGAPQVAEARDANPQPARAEVPKGTKPRLYIIGAPWCTYCRQMEATTLKDPKVVAALAAFEVKHVEIDDFDELRFHADLRAVAPRIQGVPAYVIPGGVASGK